MTQAQQVSLANHIVIEQDPVTITQSPVVDTTSKTLLFGDYKTAHGINVQVAQGPEEEDVVYDKTVWQGLFYERRIARTLKKAQRVAGVLAIKHTSQN